MLERLRISWRLAGATAQVLRRNTDLLVFPIVGLIVFGLVIALLLGAFLALADFHVETLWHAPTWAKLIATFVVYLLGYFVIFSANTALVGAAMRLLEGEQVTLADGWRIAYTHWRIILGYALLMATVGMIVRLVFRPAGWLGNMAAPVVRRMAIFITLGIAWQVVSIVILPVLVMEKIGPVAAVRRSSHLVTQCWGEGVVENINLWLIFMMPLGGLIVGGVPAVIWVSAQMQEVWLTASLYVFVMLVVVTFLLATTLSGIFSAVIYRYACDMPMAAAFEHQMLRKTFQARPSRIMRFLRRRRGHPGSAQ